MESKIYGIRHHGPGCARTLLNALAAQQPELILLESPTELEPLLHHASDEAMQTPVAALIYQKDDPEQAAFYPFAKFSPEWQAIIWANQADVPIRCFDLPASMSFAIRRADQEATEDDTETIEHMDPRVEREDPFTWFAKADGYSDGERWWNDRVEERGGSADFFTAILEAVTTLREDLDLPETLQTQRREAWMRRCIRQARKDGFTNIAIICGAWHAPALVKTLKVSEDNALLKGLPKAKVAATWTPWTLERLASQSGYGAGVRSPGWYDHLWAQPKHPTTTWLTRAARILRGQDLEGSSASVIEATRLADALAGLRGRPRAGFDECAEAMQTVFCGGDATALTLLEKPLFIGTSMGSLPEGLSELPLQQDIERQQRSLRLKQLADAQDIALDLREPGGQARSAFLHRLLALEIKWGNKQTVRTKGTFKEAWRLQWKPELLLRIIDCARYGNTLEIAAGKRLTTTNADNSLAELSERLDLALLAKLDEAAKQLLIQIDQSAANSTDTADLLSAIPALVRIARYGDVRQTNTDSVHQILDHLCARANLELPAAVTGINDEAAIYLGRLLQQYAAAVATLDATPLLESLHHTLDRIALADVAHPGPRGIAVRILYDASFYKIDQVADRLSHALSQGNAPAASAAWIEGFLSGSGSLLVHDPHLLELIDNWMLQLSAETFQNTLPILRRTFGSFTAPERARISSFITQGPSQTSSPSETPTTLSIDIDRATPAVARVAELLNLTQPTTPS